MTRAAILMVGLAALSGCSAVSNGLSFLSGERQTFSGQTYRASLGVVETDPRQFVVSVSQLEKGLGGAKEAGRYEAVTYCLKTFGWSGIDWTYGPDLPDTSLPIADGVLQLTGECKGWV